MKEISHSKPNSYTITGKELLVKVKQGCVYYESVSTSRSKGAVVASNAYVPGVDSFLDNFIKHCMKNDDFRSGLLVSLMQAYVTKL